MRSRRAYLAGIAGSVAASSGCLSRLTESPEPEQRWHFRTHESILEPSAIRPDGGSRFFQTALLSASGTRPHLRRDYLREHAEPIYQNLSLDYDRHVAAVVEVVLPTELHLNNRTATFQDSKLKYSFDVTESDRHSDGPPVNHNLEVWEKSALDDVESIELQLDVVDSPPRYLSKK